MRTDRDAIADFIASGSDAAFTALVERHYAMVHGVCRRVSGNDADADDAAQAVFLVLAAQATRVAGRDDVGGWLHHVARHVALRVRASARARTAREHSAAAAIAVEDPEDHGVDEALAELPERYRAPLVLHYYEGLSCAEVAERLRVRADNVAVRLSRGRQLLQRRLLRQGAVPALALAWLGGAHAAAAEAPAGLVQAASALAAGQQAAVASALPAATALMEAACRGMLMAKAAAIAVAASVTLAVCVGAAAAVSLLGADAPPVPAATLAVPDVDEILVTSYLDGLAERRRPRWREDLESVLETRVSFKADQQPLRALLADIARQCGHEVRVAPALGTAADMPIKLAVVKMRVVDALRWIGELANASFRIHDRTLWIDAESSADYQDEVVYHLERVLRPADAAPVPDEAELLRGLAGIVRHLSPELNATVDGGTLRTTTSVYPAVEPLDETALVMLRDHGRGSEATAPELAWRALRRQRVDWSIDGDIVAAAAALSRGSGVDVQIDPMQKTSPVHLQWSANATADEAIQEIAHQIGTSVFAGGSKLRPADEPLHWWLAPDTGFRVMNMEREPLRIFDLSAAGLAGHAQTLLDRLSALGLRQGWEWNGLLAVRLSFDRLDAFEELLVDLALQRSQDKQAAAIAAFGVGRPVVGYWGVQPSPSVEPPRTSDF